MSTRSPVLILILVFLVGCGNRLDVNNVSPKQSAVSLVQLYKSVDGSSVKEYLERKYSGDKSGWTAYGEKDKYTVEFTSYDASAAVYHVYRWEVAGGQIQAVNATSKLATPDLDPVKLQQKARILGATTEKERAVHDFMEERWKLYEQRDGTYIPDKHDPSVMSDAAHQFAITATEAEAMWDRVEKAAIGLDPNKVIMTDMAAPTVDLRIANIVYKDGVFVVTVRNENNVPLPTVNLTLHVFKGNVEVGKQVIWLENLKAHDERSYRSLKVTAAFDSFEGTAYINANELKRVGLRSSLTAHTAPGEEVVPVTELKRQNR